MLSQIFSAQSATLFEQNCTAGAAKEIGQIMKSNRLAHAGVDIGAQDEARRLLALDYDGILRPASVFARRSGALSYRNFRADNEPVLKRPNGIRRERD